MVPTFPINQLSISYKFSMILGEDHDFDKNNIPHKKDKKNNNKKREEGKN